MATNLTAVVAMVDTVLPGMRARGGGQVVVISSYAAWRFSPHAGVAYTASKTALAAAVPRSTPRRPSTASGPATSAPAMWTPTSWPCDRRFRMPRLGWSCCRPTTSAAVLFVLQSPAHVRIDELVISPVSQV